MKESIRVLKEGRMCIDTENNLITGITFHPGIRDSQSHNHANGVIPGHIFTAPVLHSHTTDS